MKTSEISTFSSHGAIPTSPAGSVSSSTGPDAGAGAGPDAAAGGAPLKSFASATIPGYIPSWFRFDDAPVDATGLNFDFFARATIIMSTVFLGPALLKLSSEAAGCVAETVEDEDNCENARVYGMKPSSLLTNMAMVTGLIAAITMPLVGAIVDHTSYRKQVGAWTAYGMTLVMGINATVSRKTWFFVAIMQSLGAGFLYNTHIVVTYAYTSELSKDPVVQTKYNSFFFVVLYASILIFMAETLGFTLIFKTSEVGTARISQIITTITTAILFCIAWNRLFTDRPPSSKLEEGRSIWTAGFVKVWRTCKEIAHTNPALLILMFSIMCSEAATATLVSIATTYMVNFLDMNSIEVGIAYFFILFMGIPGAKLGEWLALRASPRISAMGALLFFVIVTSGASFVLEGPDHKQWMNLFGVLWGLGLGWLHPTNTTMFISLTPEHSQTEYMGIYNFAQTIIGWLPPLVFTVMNEHGIPMNFGLSSLNIFFSKAFFCLLMMGLYQDASGTPRPPSEKDLTVSEDIEAADVNLPPVA